MYIIMKNFRNIFFNKIIAGILLLCFGFSLQSFNGYRIEKRHYRKGYYIHICHAPKPKPVYQANEKSTLKEEKPVSDPPAIPATQQQEQQAPASSDRDEPTRSTAPTSRAIPQQINRK
jgi:hypothetical protein